MGDLYVQNKGMIRKLASRLQPDRNELEDAMQDAYFGLVAAVNAYDESKGYKFITYASKHIGNAIRRGKSCTQPIPEWVSLKSNKIKKAQNDLAYILKRMPSTAEIAAAVGLTVNDIQHTLIAVLPPRSIEMPLVDDLTIADTIPDKTIDFENQIAEADYNLRRKNAIRSVIDELPAPDREIIEHIFFYNHTQAAAAKYLNIDTKQVYIKLKSAISKLQHYKIKKRLEEFSKPFSWANIR